VLWEAIDFYTAREGPHLLEDAELEQLRESFPAWLRSEPHTRI
jgi:hypothetical protein